MKSPSLFREPPPRATAAGPERSAPGSRQTPYSVRELSARIRKIVEAGFPRRGVWIEAEVHEARGTYHLYLTFKEGSALLQAIIWGSTLQRLSFRPKRGDVVRAFGEVKTYEGRSRYQLILSRVERAGLGRLLAELQKREARLESEGLFEKSRKRKLPFLPLRIGLLTASDSDARRDFVTNALRRFPALEISERDTRVQGSAAVPDLVAGMRWLGRRDLDLIVVTRGGGSAEDLLPFSEEAVIRAAARCPVPLVSAIGHDRDRPLLDRVADYRAATPTAAAKEIIPDRNELQKEIADRLDSAGRAVSGRLSAATERVSAFRSHRATAALDGWIDNEAAARRADRQRLRERGREAVSDQEVRVRRLADRLDGTHPERRLRDQEGRLARLREQLAGIALLDLHRQRVQATGSRVRDAFLQAERSLTGERAALASWSDRLSHRTSRHFGRMETCIRTSGLQLAGRDPRAPLRRGYGLALDADGRAVYSAAAVVPGERLRLLLGRGELGVRVEETRPGQHDDGEARGGSR